MHSLEHLLLWGLKEVNAQTERLKNATIAYCAPQSACSQLHQTCSKPTPSKPTSGIARQILHNVDSNEQSTQHFPELKPKNSLTLFWKL
jgi:hypothetical protein